MSKDLASHWPSIIRVYVFLLTASCASPKYMYYFKWKLNQSLLSPRYAGYYLSCTSSVIGVHICVILSNIIESLSTWLTR